jgi:rRNA (uridine-N3-)-methyltransferase BTM5-like
LKILFLIWKSTMPRKSAKAKRVKEKRQRLRKRREAEMIAKHQQQKKQKEMAKRATAKASDTRRRRILVVGDGDLSFSVALARKLEHRNDVIVATTFDQKYKLLEKYGARAERALEALESVRGNRVVVLHGVDATRLGTWIYDRCNHKDLSAAHGFDLIVFNFPHSGQQRVHLNRALVRNFFNAATRVLASGADARVHMAIKQQPPYSLWNIVDIADKESPLRFDDTRPFYTGDYPGYLHQTTIANAKPVGIKHDQAMTYMFKLQVERKASEKGKGKRLAEVEEKDDGEQQHDHDEEQAMPKEVAKKRQRGFEKNDGSKSKKQRKR